MTTCYYTWPFKHKSRHHLNEQREGMSKRYSSSANSATIPQKALEHCSYLKSLMTPLSSHFLRKDENINSFPPPFPPPLSAETTPLRLSSSMNWRMISQSRTNTGGSPTGARTSMVFPMLCGPAT